MTTPTDKLRALIDELRLNSRTLYDKAVLVALREDSNRDDRATVDVAKRSYEAANDVANALPSLLAELEAAREDAERYRWLRGYNTAWHPEVTHAFYLGSDNLDAAIDAARHAAATLGGEG